MDGGFCVQLGAGGGGSSHQSLSRLGLGSKGGPELRVHVAFRVRQANDGSRGPKMVPVSSSLKRNFQVPPPNTSFLPSWGL